jgi:hypothetical protein
MEKKLNYQEYLKDKKELCKAFLDLSQKEQQAIAETNYDLLLELLTEKDKIIDQVNQIDAQLGTFTEKEAQDPNGLKADIINILSGAKEIDEQNQTVLKKDFDATSQLVKQTHNMKKSSALYRGDEISIKGILLDKNK